MSELIIGILAAGAGGALTLLIVAAANALRTNSSIPHRVTRLEEIAALQLDALDANTEGMIAIAEAVSGKRCNGNVDKAITRLEGSKAKTTAYVNAHVAGGAR